MSFAPHAAAVLFLLEEEGHHAEKFLGIPLPIWQLVNLVLFLAVLAYFVAKPLTNAFRNRQLEIEKRTKETEHRRAEVDRFAREIEERTVRLEREIEDVRRQGVADGQVARAELLARAEQEAERVRKEASEEIDRRLAQAKTQLSRTSADLTAQSAVEILSREITDEDRHRLLEDGVDRLQRDAR